MPDVPWHRTCTPSSVQAPPEALSTPDLANDAPQRVVKVRRDYNAWVGSETMEDYALRFTPQRFRKWSEWRVANTAFGAASFLILEAPRCWRSMALPMRFGPSWSRG